MAQGKLTSTLTNVMATYYDKRFIEWEKELLRMQQFAQMRPIPRNNGKTVQFTGYIPLDIVTSALTEGTNPANNAFAARSVTATVAEWGATAKLSKLLELTKLDSGLEEQTNLMADQAARSIDYQMMREVCRNGVWGICAVPKATNTLTVTLKSSASNSTTRFVAATHVSGGHSWVGAIATVVKDGNAAGNTSAGGRVHKYGYAGRISAFVSKGPGTPGDVWTLITVAPNAAAPAAFQSGDKVHIAGYAAQAATSVLATASVRYAQRDLVNNKAMPFGDGYYGALTSPYPDADFKGDTTWVNAASYSNVTELYKGEIGRWFGFRFVETTQPYRDGVTGVEDRAGGAMFHNLFFGRNAFGHTKIDAAQRLMYVLSGPDKSDPLDMNTIVGWKQVFANKAITAPHIVDIVTGATA